MRAYPWRQRNHFEGSRFFGGTVRKIATLLRIIAAIFSLGISEIVQWVAMRRYRKINDTWYKRGLVLLALGVGFTVAAGAPVNWAQSWLDLAYSFGEEATMEPQEAVFQLLAYGLPMALAAVGIVLLARSYEVFYAGERFIRKTLPTSSTKARLKKNTKALRRGRLGGDGWLRFGVMTNDSIPWRTPRHGMICARPLKRLGHGAIIGGSDSGKTVLATNIGDQALKSDAAVFYIDYKASKSTFDAVRAIATINNVPFYSFDLGIGSNEMSWYDPLDWEGDPSDKASMLVSSFNFPDTGEISFYRNVAESWLTFQFQVLSIIGKSDSESNFDFLLGTSSPQRMRERIEHLKKGDDRDRVAYEAWVTYMKEVKPDHLTNLRSNLNTVINAGGSRLRPQGDTPAINLNSAADEGAVVYVGLSPSTNEVALKIIGSLVLRDLGVVAGVRMRAKEDSKKALRPVLALVDEASRMGNRAVVMDNLFTQAREGLIWVWPITQTFTTWPDSTVNDMNANVQTVVSFRVPDPETAEHLESTLGNIPALEEFTEEHIDRRSVEGDVAERDGDARRKVVQAPFLIDAPYPLGRIENHHCYVWFTGSHSRATKKKWKPRYPIRGDNKDQVDLDVPLVRVISSDQIANPPEPVERSLGFKDAAPDIDTIQRQWDASNGQDNPKTTETPEPANPQKYGPSAEEVSADRPQPAGPQAPEPPQVPEHDQSQGQQQESAPAVTEPPPIQWDDEEPQSDEWAPEPPQDDEPEWGEPIHEPVQEPVQVEAETEESEHPTPEPQSPEPAPVAKAPDPKKGSKPATASEERRKRWA